MNNFFEDIINNALTESVQVVAKFDQAELETADVGIEDREIPILPLRNMMLFPQTLLPVNVNRESALQLLSEAEKHKLTIAVCGQKREDIEQPMQDDLFPTGVLSRVVKILKLPDGSRTAFLQGLSRIRLIEAHRGDRYLMGHVERFPEILPEKNDREFRATTEACKDIADKFLLRGDGMRIESSFSLNDLQSRIFFVNFVCGSLSISNQEHMMLLEETVMTERAKKLLTILGREAQFAQLKASIQMQTQADLSRGQREFFLRKEMENIKEELGEDDEEEVQKLRERAKKKKWTADIQQRFDKEVQRLERQSSQSPEYGTQLDYLNLLLDLPWGEMTKDRIDLNAAERILNHDHYGMESVKERILEYLAVLKMRREGGKGYMSPTIICLYGPPGVGKTSLGKSIAAAMKRKYVRVSLGGVQDEAEIRGHRRTYIGAMPGRIIKGLQEAGTSNPVFILDEIDKVGQNPVHGDPASALLEVLDPEQNKAFHDNYVDMDYDVSNVMFIATANNISTIPAPLLDRMELIEVSGYLTEEKLEIAKRHLVPKQLENVGMKRGEVKFSKQALEKIIEDYTRESGVRELDKKISKVLRKIALKKAKDEEFALNAQLSALNIRELLGTELFSREKDENADNIGVVTGLAWTAVGGEILFVETSLSKGKGSKLTLTGNLGDVMKESAMLALEYIKAHADELNIPAETFEEWNVHIHVPEGAVPKDGPSAGITIATSIASAFTHRKVRRKLAMTGEITLRGKVMPVGGIKEKILAAKRAGVTDIVLCRENEKNIKDIPEKYVKGLTFHYVERVEEVLRFALL